MTDIFLDSSVLFSAINSVEGGSSKLFSLQNVKIYTSKTVLAEIERNVNNKLENYHVKRFEYLLTKIIRINPRPSAKELSEVEEVIARKDAKILWEFKVSTCLLLITLDKKDFLQKAPKNFVHPKKIINTKEFYKHYYKL